MKVGILGSGSVGRTLAAKVSGLVDHEVGIGTRDVAQLMAPKPSAPNEPEAFATWHSRYPQVRVGSFRDIATWAEVVFHATNGAGALAALRLAGRDALSGKVVIDVANPLDFSRGFPPSLLVVNTDSLAEQIQRELPDSRVVKSLNTVPAGLMVDPAGLAGGDHHIFVSGNDPGAKGEVITILRDWFGWTHIIDLGDITSARGTEMYLALWVRLLGAVGGRPFNVRVVVNDGEGS